VAHYETTVASRLAPADAFAYMSDFSNARSWDPSVSRAELAPDGEGLPAYDLVARFAGRDVALRYTVIALEPPTRVVLEATKPSFVSRDTITIAPAPGGSTVHYDAQLRFSGPSRVLEPLLQRIFCSVGNRARAGLEQALNP
jgi:hypothetical protein